jgi:signal transduction histidine kinase
VAAADGLRVASVLCWGQQCAALVFLPETGCEPAAAVLADRAAALLGPAFEKAALIEGNVARADALAATSQRRLTRLGFDLHDGPLQDVAVLAGDLDNLRRRVEDALGDSPLGRELLAEVEDAAAVAQFLDGDLRDLATSIDGTGLTRARFDDVVAGLVRKFTSRTDAEAEMTITGETDSLTDSQKITVTRVVQEALANVREHSGADRVGITIEAGDAQVQVTISDNGVGFDVEESMRRAGRAGRLGLAGMVERVRLLGGVCDIASRPGAGTRISLTIARWVPASAAEQRDAAPAAHRAG